VKPTWIYEHGVFGTEEQPEADEQFVAALERQNLEVLEFDKNSMLRGDFVSRLNKVRIFGSHTYRGSFRNCRSMSLDQTVGIDDWSNYNCSTWLTHFGEFALNSKYLILSLSELWRRRAEILDYFQSLGELFIRPDSGLKPFHGGVINLTDYRSLEQLCNYLRQSKGFKVLVAPRQEIVNEWRCFMYGDRFVTGSRYTICGEQFRYPIKQDVGLVQEIEEIVRSACWYPSALWSVDFCTPSRVGDHHELKVVELGSYHCAGVYASDLDKYIEAANDFAIKMSNEDDN
jgi:hypothetical protein